MNSADFADYLLDTAGVAVLSGASFGNYGEGFIRTLLRQFNGEPGKRSGPNRRSHPADQSVILFGISLSIDSLSSFDYSSIRTYGGKKIANV